MSAPDDITPPPAVVVEIVSDQTAGSRCDVGFLRVRRLTLRNRYADGSASAEYRYDVVERDATDAVGIVLEANGPSGPSICLRTAMRPPMALRSSMKLPLPEPVSQGSLWEIPAGLVEPDERGEAGIRACAARETLEEVGLDVSPDAFTMLGPAVALSPGVLGERVHFLHAIVDPSHAGEPSLDGSPVEERALIRFVPLARALEAIRAGLVADVKTEVAVRRLLELRGRT
jgi:ADP-ribose pyrophosphatase